MSQLTNPRGKRAKDINSVGAASNQDSVSSNPVSTSPLHKTFGLGGEPEQLVPLDLSVQKGTVTPSKAPSVPDSSATDIVTGTSPREEFNRSQFFLALLGEAMLGANPITNLLPSLPALGVDPIVEFAVPETMMETSPGTKNPVTVPMKQPSAITSFLVTEETTVMSPIVTTPVNHPRLEEAKLFKIPLLDSSGSQCHKTQAVPVVPATVSGLAVEMSSVLTAAEPPLETTPSVTAPVLKSSAIENPDTTHSTHRIPENTVKNDIVKSCKDIKNQSSEDRASPNLQGSQVSANVSETLKSENASGVIEKDPPVVQNTLPFTNILFQVYMQAYLVPFINALSN